MKSGKQVHALITVSNDVSCVYCPGHAFTSLWRDTVLATQCLRGYSLVTTCTCVMANEHTKGVFHFERSSWPLYLQQNLESDCGRNPHCTKKKNRKGLNTSVCLYPRVCLLCQTLWYNCLKCLRNNLKHIKGSIIHLTTQYFVPFSEHRWQPHATWIVP